MARFRATGLVELQEITMDAHHEHNCLGDSEYLDAQSVQTEYTGLEGIYIDVEGALRVRVTNLRADNSHVEVDVEEIITPGLGVGVFARDYPPVTPPFRFNIVADSLGFYFGSWEIGYGGWMLHFDSRIVQAVIAIGARRSNNVDPHEGFSEVFRVIEHYRRHLE